MRPRNREGRGRIEKGIGNRPHQDKRYGLTTYEDQDGRGVLDAKILITHAHEKNSAAQFTVRPGGSDLIDCWKFNVT